MSLAGYEFQLKQVKDSLAQDPNNENLKRLAKKIEDLIGLQSISLDESLKTEGALSNKLIDLSVGERCEVKNEKDGHWEPASIQSISFDKLSCVAIFADGRAMHCIKSQVRRLTLQSSEVVQATEEVMANEKDKSKVNSRSSKRKHTRQEHEQKKEAEQKEKQLHWKSFSSKISKPTLFKKINPSSKTI